MLAGLGLGAGVAVGSVGAAIGLASARQEVKWKILLLKWENCKVFLFVHPITINTVVLPKFNILIITFWTLLYQLATIKLE